MQLLYFAWLRERMGRSGEEIVRPEGVATVADLIDWLRARDPAGANAFAVSGVIRAAVNETFAQPDTALTDQDEVAFFPPVTGG